MLVSSIDKANPWKKRVHVHTALQRNPRWNRSSQAERDVHGADGRWLWRGVAEREIVLKIPESEALKI